MLVQLPDFTPKQSFKALIKEIFKSSPNYGRIIIKEGRKEAEKKANDGYCYAEKADSAALYKEFRVHRLLDLHPIIDPF